MFLNQSYKWVKPYILVLAFGLLLPLGFAPFHLTPLAFISIALFYFTLERSKKSSFWLGFIYGISFFGLSLYWIYDALYILTHIALLAAILTTLLISYLSVFMGLASYFFSILRRDSSPILNLFLFSCLWITFEIFRAHCLGGFPWVLLGYAQIDTPLAATIPFIGIYGAGFLACIASTLMAQLFLVKKELIKYYLLSLLILLYLPAMCSWPSITNSKPLSVAIVQVNQLMDNKWDQEKFSTILKNLEKQIDKSLTQEIIVLPETAITVAIQYIHSFIEKLKYKANQSGSTILLGIPIALDKIHFANSLHVIGKGSGVHLKQHLVVFGEYVPQLFSKLVTWLSLPLNNNFIEGNSEQKLAMAQGRPFVSLICFELAFEDIIRSQLPRGQWIVSISDDAGFGQTIQPYQQLQIAQVRSLQTGRYQIVANNNGLSSIIAPSGEIIKSLPFFYEGILEGSIVPIADNTPWVLFGNKPIYFILIMTLSLTILIRVKTWISIKIFQKHLSELSI